MGGRGMPEGMASYAASERAMRSALIDLHDILWAGARYDEGRLLRRLGIGARNLDEHLGTKGATARAVRPLLQDFQPVTTGPDLFTFLRVVTSLASAADRVERQPREAVRHASELAVSLTVHLASAADRRDLVEGFESGRSDFAEFSGVLTEALEQRGVLRAREFGRSANVAFDVNALWDKNATKDVQRISAAAAVSSSAFGCVLFVEALRSLGRYRDVPYGRLVPVVGRILHRLG